MLKWWETQISASLNFGCNLHLIMFSLSTCSFIMFLLRLNCLYRQRHHIIWRKWSLKFLKHPIMWRKWSLKFVKHSVGICMWRQPFASCRTILQCLAPRMASLAELSMKSLCKWQTILIDWVSNRSSWFNPYALRRINNNQWPVA